MEVDPLILELRADARKFASDLTQAQTVSEARLARIEKSGARMGQSLNGAFNLAKGAAVGFVASLGVDAVVRAVNAGLQYAASLAETAQQLGVTTNALQEFRYAGSQAGLATEETDQALSQLTRRIGEAASGTKAQAEAFDKLGVSVRDANGEIINAGEAIPEIADALQNIESPAERAAILMDLFGRSGQKLEALLSGGSKAVNQLRDAAHKLGIVLSEEQIAKADETADKLDALKQVLSANIAGAVADNSDSILAFANALVTLVGAAGSAIRVLNELYGVIANKPGNLIEKVGGTKIGGGALRTPAQIAADKAKPGLSDAAFQAYLKKNNLQRPPRINFAAQRDFGAEFSAALTPAEGAAAALGPTPQQQALLSQKLSAGTQELLSIYLELSNVAADLIDTTEARVIAEKAQIEIDKVQAIERIKANDDLTNEQKNLAVLGLEKVAEGKRELADLKLQAAERERELEAAQESADIAQAQNDALVESLRGQYDLADSQAERRDLALRIIEAEFDYLESVQEGIIASEQATEAQKEIARLKLEQLQAERGAQIAGAKKQTAGPLESYIDRATLNADEMNEALQGVAVNGLDELNDGLTDAIMNSENLGDVFKNVAKSIIADLIRIAVQQLIVNSLMSALGGGLGGIFGGGGGGGFASGVLGTAGRVFGRASGGHVNAGSVYRVNESNKEFFKPNNSGNIIPLSKMNAAMTGGGNAGGSVVTLRVEMTDDLNARIQSQSAEVAVEVVRTAAPQIRDAAVNETFRRGSRPGFRK